MTKHKNKKALIFIGLGVIAIIIAVIISVILINVNARHCSGLLGTWEYSGTEYSGSYIYTFEGEGRGRYEMAGEILNFEYEDFSDSFSILFSGNEIPAAYNYQISEDGQTLTIQDSLGDPITYVCK